MFAHAQLKVLIVTLIFSLAIPTLAFSQGGSAPPQGEKVFRCLQGTPGSSLLDFAAMREEFGGGQVTVRAHLGEKGRVNRTEVLEEGLRSGSEQFWSAVAAVIQSWRYTVSEGQAPYQIPSFIDYTVILPKPNQLASGTLEISAALLSLNQGWTINVDHPEDLANYAGIGRKDIVMTSLPPEVRPVSTGIVSSTIANLRGFRYIFLALAIASLIVLIISTIQVMHPWYPGGWRAIRPLSGILQFEREPGVIADIRELWVKGIHDSRWSGPRELPFSKADVQALEHLLGAGDRNAFLHSLEPLDDNPLLRSFEVSRWRESLGTRTGADELGKLKQRILEIIAKKPEEERRLAERLVEKAEDASELADLARELGFSQPEEQAVADDSLLEIKKTVSDRIELARTILAATPGTVMSPEQKSSIQNFLWEFFGKAKINEALGRVREYLGMSGDQRPLRHARRRSADLFRVFESGLENHLINENRPEASEEIDRAIDRTLGVIAENRKSRLEWLWALGGLSPLLGLFGTVWGISQAFGKIHRIQNMRHVLHSLAGEINVALATTIVGLAIAVLLVIFYYGLKTRAEGDALAVDTYFTEITNRV